MSEEEKKKTTKTTAKKSPAKKAAPKKAASKTKTTASKKDAPAAKKKAAAPSKTVTVTQVGSPIGRQPYQRQTLIGLGLNKMHRTRTLEDTPAVRGMINKVKHLVKIEEAA